MKKIILIILSLGLSLSASADSSENIRVRGALTEILNKIDANRSDYKREQKELVTFMNEEFLDYAYYEPTYFANDYPCLGDIKDRRNYFTTEEEVYDCKKKALTEKYLENKSNYTKIAISLIKLCPDLNTLDKNGQTLLTRVISSSSEYGDEYEEIAEALLNNVDINVQNKAGNTPLMVAVIHGRTSIAIDLIKKGAKLNVQNEVGKTVLEIAAKEGNINIMNLLIGATADSCSNKNKTDKNSPKSCPGV